MKVVKWMAIVFFTLFLVKSCVSWVVEVRSEILDLRVKEEVVANALNAVSEVEGGENELTY